MELDSAVCSVIFAAGVDEEGDLGRILSDPAACASVELGLLMQEIRSLVFTERSVIWISGYRMRGICLQDFTGRLPGS